MSYHFKCVTVICTHRQTIIHFFRPKSGWKIFDYYVAYHILKLFSDGEGSTRVSSDDSDDDTVILDEVNGGNATDESMLAANGGGDAVWHTVNIVEDNGDNVGELTVNIVEENDGNVTDEPVLAANGGGNVTDEPVLAANGGGNVTDEPVLAANGGGNVINEPVLAANGGGNVTDEPVLAANGGGNVTDEPVLAANGGGNVINEPVLAANGGGNVTDEPVLAANGGGNVTNEPVLAANGGADIGAMLDANRNEDGTVDASNEGVDEITKKTSRKRARKEEGWKRNVKSRKYQTGQVRKYKGEERARSVRGRCKPTCRRNCSQISNEQQQDIHNMFWSIGDATRRHDFMIHNVRRVAKKRTTTENSRRANSQFYFLPLGGSDTSVCKTFFMNTLDVSHMSIGYALDHCEHGLISPNLRVISSLIVRQVFLISCLYFSKRSL